MGGYVIPMLNKAMALYSGPKEMLERVCLRIHEGGRSETPAAHPRQLRPSRLKLCRHKPPPVPPKPQQPCCSGAQ